MPPFANYANFADCVRQNPQADDPDAYCGSIQARTENKAVRQHGKDIYGKRPGETGRGPAHAHPHKTGPTSVKKAVTAASITHQAVRNALLSVVAKRDPVKEEGDKKLKEADGVAADGAQDDQPFAVAFGPDNYDKLTKRILAAPYREAYQAAGAIVKAIERKQMNMNFPGNLEDHLKKAHAAVHGREMWDERYSDICDLLKKARKLLHDIEREAEAADQQQQGQEAKQVVGKADPVDKAPVKKVGTGTYGVGRQAGPPERGPRPGQKPETFLGKPVSPATPSSRTGMRPAGWGTPADQRRGRAQKAVRKAAKAAAGR